MHRLTLNDQWWFTSLGKQVNGKCIELNKANVVLFVMILSHMISHSSIWFILPIRFSSFFFVASFDCNQWIWGKRKKDFLTPFQQLQRTNLQRFCAQMYIIFHKLRCRPVGRQTFEIANFSYFRSFAYAITKCHLNEWMFDKYYSVAKKKNSFDWKHNAQRFAPRQTTIIVVFTLLCSVSSIFCPIRYNHNSNEFVVCLFLLSICVTTAHNFSEIFFLPWKKRTLSAERKLKIHRRVWKKKSAFELFNRNKRQYDCML